MIDSFKGKYRWLSNFWLCPVILEGVIYPSVENAYQASKTLDDRSYFVTCSPAKAKKFGQGDDIVLRFDWEDVKLTAMRKLLNQKFQMGTYNSILLMATGEIGIVEGNTWGDVFWGVCEDVGENNLGKMLMAIRHSLLNY